VPLAHQMGTMRITSGTLLIATGILHQLVGFVAGLALTVDGVERNLLAEVAELGVVDSIVADLARTAWFWFLVTGFALVILGDLARRIENRGTVLPASLGWQLLALGIAGGVLMPASGFWLVVPQGAWIVLRARRQMAVRAIPIA